MKNHIIAIIVLISLTACGGGGGGGGGSVYSGINWSTAGTTFGTSAYLRDYGSSVTSNSKALCQPSAESCTIGAEIYVNGSSIKISSDHGSYEVDFSPGYTFDSSDYVNSVNDNTGNTLSSVNHNWSSNDVANGYTRKFTYIVPDNYANQRWLYWDNTHGTTSSYNTYYIGVVGNPYTSYSSLPTSGSATYTGGAELLWGTDTAIYSGSGTASFVANWGSQTIGGTIGSIALSSSEAGNITFPTMTMAQTSIRESSYSLGGETFAYFSGDLSFTGANSSSAYNDINGYFMGNSYEEIGGTFDIGSQSGNDGAGYFAVKR